MSNEITIIDNKTGDLVTPDQAWYELLVDDCKAIITEGIFNSRWALVEMYHQLGERIVTDSNLESYGRGNEKILQGLARLINISQRSIYYAVEFYQKYPRLDTVPEGKNISWNKIITKYLPEPKLSITPLSQNSSEKNYLKLYKGDMVELMPQLGKFDLVVTDPPYGVTDLEWDNLSTSQWLNAIIPHLQDKFNIFWFCSPQFAADTEMIFRLHDLPLQSRIVWHRRNMAMGSTARNKFIDTWEMILHAGNRELNFPSEWSDAWFDVQEFAVPQTNFTDTKLHPTQKPEGLIQRLVEFGSYPGDHILDPFAGSGTTGAVCPNDRECTLIEREESYVGIAEGRLGINRWQA